MLQVLTGQRTERFRHVLVVRERIGDTAVYRAYREAGARIVHLGTPGRDRLWPFRLAEVLRQEQVDVLHVRGLAMLVDALLAARMAGDVATAFSFHGFELAADPAGGGRHFSRWRRWAYRRAVQRCVARWAVSRTAADAIADELALPHECFDVLPNGVDAGRFRPADQREGIRRVLGLPADRSILLAVGNLKPIKGHDVLLEAVRLLRDEAHRITVVIVGRDYTDGLLAGWADVHLPEVDIRFVGPQADPLPWYQAADLFVLPSRWEGMSNALLEAMAAGLPVIATAVGGNVDVVEHGKTGLLTTPNQPAAIAAAISRLLNDRAECRVLGAAARQVVEERFAAVRTAELYAERYAALGARPSRRRGHGTTPGRLLVQHSPTSSTPGRSRESVVSNGHACLEAGTPPRKAYPEPVVGVEGVVK